MRKKKLAYLLLSTALCPLSALSQTDLSGEWQVRLDGSTETHLLRLPGTTDDAGLGAPNSLKPELTKPQLLHLTRKHSFVGNADYSRKITIPAAMAGRPLRVTLERVLWKSSLTVDGKSLGQEQESLTTPHVYVIPEGLAEGEHTLTVSVDNSKRYEVSGGDMAHAYTNETQIIWNGVLGSMTLDTIPETDITDLQVYPDPEKGSVTFRAVVDNRRNKKSQADLMWSISGLTTKSIPLSARQKVELRPGADTLEVTVSDASLSRELWSEFTPRVLNLSVSVAGAERNVDFGMRKVENRNGVLTVNDQPVFLRGTLECCVFPLTGTPPTTEEGWEKVFDAASAWGLNHLRFHSWCPPEAAFRVADRRGFYIQVECPLWSTSISTDSTVADGAMKRFVRSELDRIITTYGNHPSFCLMTMGNELQSDFDWLGELTRHAHATDPRRLYAASSFTFEKGHGGHPEPDDDFLVTQWTDRGWVRGQGVFDAEAPSFAKNYASSTEGLTVPLIEHEIGQYAVYPDLSEIDRYTGVLKPLNFIAVRDDLAKRGMLSRAPEFLRASGKLAAVLYKEEIERAMKTPGVSGFQLLGLQDFPGQGTALVGLVNAFWDSKGVVDSDWFSRFCAPAVPLASFEKAVYTSDETFRANLSLSNYSGYTGSWTARWSLADENGELAGEGTLAGPELSAGLNAFGDIAVQLGNGEEARKLVLTVRVPELDAENSWSVWVYPRHDGAPRTGKVRTTRSTDEAIALLEEGHDVLLVPYSNDSTLRTLKGGRPSKFVPVFWSPVHFPSQAGAMGLTCREDHPALSLYPNDGHTDWQWWHALKQSAHVSLEGYPEAEPVIGMVDNFTTNRPLALVFETRVGKGRLMVSLIDVLNGADGESHPSVRQLLESFLSYMNSQSFNPKGTMSGDALRSLLDRPL